MRPGGLGELMWPHADGSGARRTSPSAEDALPWLVALVLAPRARAWLASALHGRARVLPVRTCREVVRCMETGGVRAVVVELRDVENTPVAPTIQRLRAQWPLVPVLAYCAVRNPSAPDLLAAARAGLNGLLVADGDGQANSLLDVLGTFAQAEDEVTARRAWAAVSDVVPESARVVVEYCLTHGRQALTVDEVARALGMHRKTLWMRLDRTGLPSPEKLINWARLLHAAHRLETTKLSLARIATEHSYGTRGALRNMLFRYTGLTPATIQAPGGFERILAAFRAELQARSRHGVIGTA
jgi:AraC-like DNA-binding protein